MNKGICTVKKKIVLRNLRLNLRRDTATLVLIEYTEVTNKGESKHRGKSVNEVVIKFKSIKCKNRGDKRRVW